MTWVSTGTWQGYRVQVSEYMTVEDGFDVVRRTWYERLLTRPWRPLKVTKNIARPWKPDPQVLILDDTTIVCHPEVWKRIKEAL